MNNISNNYISKLIKKIKELNYYYYIKNISIIPNKKYDILINKLYYIEKKYPHLFKKYTPLLNINKCINNNKKKYHIIPMLSIKSTYNINYIFNFFNKIKKNIKTNKIELCCELKIDGIAVNLIYKNGKLIEALTRGNGFIGENIINNINKINSIPKYIKYYKNSLIEIRGEIFIYKNDLIEINNISNKKFSNERNAASSLIRKKKNDLLKKYLRFICHGIGYYNELNINKYSNVINFMRSNKFNINNYKIINKYKYLKKYIHNIINNRNNIKYPIDGIVIKINSINIQNMLGSNYYYPKYILAYKFNINNIVSKITNINLNINKYGNIIPVANIDNILINGIIINKINLYNINYILKNKININSIIYLNIIGEMIPKITNVINNKNIIKFKINNICYSCKKKLYINNNEYICNNKYYLCKSKFISNLKNFISEKAFNIRNIGEKLINKIIDKKIINKNYDIFKIKIEDLLKENFNINESIKIIKSIKNSKNIDIKNFIYSLNIKNVGIITSNYISENINNIYDLFYIKDNNNLFKNKKIKNNIINNIKIFFNKEENLEEIKNIINLGIKINYINTNMGCTGIEPVTN
ncbi:NAD-dependent DNA ligase LigA [Candidatus Nardonella dryophthoridicola]|uniref:DNA ligase (NAD(+)) n=1 Tax=endosymbiont of Rhynchophorus ferrugineus TaxID=1972133 RepID=A0A2Z5TIA7_9GAMM|nr:NAD-dependent DNA ligase LigA [Candidatus Nardonella dryophthoridicola]BBA85012.1 DNA ligase [endosymbiont of Rhynchophorus ferrugineus]